MKYICNHCGKVIQKHDVTIHYIKDFDGLEIVAVCQLCLEKYLEDKRENTYRKKMKLKE